MGDLKYSVLIEELTGHTGIKLLESKIFRYLLVRKDN